MDAEWFSVELNRINAPWAYLKGEPFKAIAALELFGTLVSLRVFGKRWPTAARGMIQVTAATDNKGNSQILPKMMTTKFPLLLVLAEISEQIRRNNWSLQLEWTPRQQNIFADALTNEDYAAFTPEKRIDVRVENLKWEVLPEMGIMADELYRQVLRKREAARRKKVDREGKPAGRHRRLKEREPWV